MSLCPNSSSIFSDELSGSEVSGYLVGVYIVYDDVCLAVGMVSLAAAAAAAERNSGSKKAPSSALCGVKTCGHTGEYLAPATAQQLFGGSQLAGDGVAVERRGRGQARRSPAPGRGVLTRGDVGRRVGARLGRQRRREGGVRGGILTRVQRVQGAQDGVELR